MEDMRQSATVQFQYLVTGFDEPDSDGPTRHWKEWRTHTSEPMPRDAAVALANGLTDLATSRDIPVFRNVVTI